MARSNAAQLSALRRRIRNGGLAYLGLLLGVFLYLLQANFSEIARFFEHVWIFLPIGIFGAIIANSTGTGGGVVFVPAFNSLSGAADMGVIPMDISVDPVSTIGISFLIQCFGMSVGAVSWVWRFYGSDTPADGRIDGYSFINIIFTILITTIPALLVTQWVLFGSVDGSALLTAFKWFSLVLGVVLLVFTWAYQRVKPYRFRPEMTDTYWLLGLGAIGGVITAFFSVGVGELVAVYLIFRKFPTPAAIAIAVVVSVVTVISGASYHLVNGNVIWPIALMAIPGAMIGGFIARLFAVWLGPLWLKTFASVWIIASSAFLILGPLLGVLSK
jgi:uncharacterized membrane protein YfcA